MRKVLQFILTFIIGISIFLAPSNIVKAEEIEEKSISDNKVMLWIDNANSLASSFWGGFKFLDMGDGTVRFRPIINGQIGNANELPSNLFLGHPYTVKFYDNEGSVYYSKQFTSGYLVRDFASEIGNVKMRYGLDSFQISYISNTNLIQILGTIHSNLDSSSFHKLSKNTSQMYSFRVERDGLYAQYINQVRIPDGEYIIETAWNPDRVLDVFSEYNAGVGNYNSNSNYQKFNLEYDTTNKAYKIRSNYYGNVLNWQSNTGNDANYSYDRNFSEQFWYLQRTSNDNYRLINAKDTSKSLNLDANNYNISVANTSDSIKQQFKFIKPSDKQNADIIQITPKITSNKILDVNTTSYNVTLYDNNKTNNQKWILEYVESKNAYLIKSLLDGRVLAWDSSKGSNVITYKYINSDDQYWILDNLGNGEYIIKSYKNPNMVLDVYGSNTSSGTNIQVFQRKDSDNQKFYITR